MQKRTVILIFTLDEDLPPIIDLGNGNYLVKVGFVPYDGS